MTDVESGEVVTHATEDELYAFFGYAPIPPELREGTAEIQRLVISRAISGRKIQ